MSEQRVKLERILRAKSPFTEEQIAAMSDVDGWDWIYANRANTTTSPKIRSSEICFTGFSAVEAAELKAIVDGCGHLQLVASVTRTLRYLCHGSNAGPKKMEKARAAGVQLLDREQFERLARNGELPA